MTEERIVTPPEPERPPEKTSPGGPLGEASIEGVTALGNALSEALRKARQEADAARFADAADQVVAIYKKLVEAHGPTTPSQEDHRGKCMELAVELFDKVKVHMQIEARIARSAQAVNPFYRLQAQHRRQEAHDDSEQAAYERHTQARETAARLFERQRAAGEGGEAECHTGS